MHFELARERLVCAGGGTAAPELVNGGIAQGPIGPGNDAFIPGRLVASCHDPGEGLLDDVLGQCSISDATLQVAEKGALVFDEHGERSVALCFHHPIVRVVDVRCDSCIGKPTISPLINRAPTVELGVLDADQGHDCHSPGRQR